MSVPDWLPRPTPKGTDWLPGTTPKDKQWAHDQLAYRADPAGWAKARLGAHMWSRQQTIAESVRDHRYTAVRSCFDMGKSWLASTLAAWWLDVHPIGEAFVVTTAPTWPQVRAILWREIAARFADAKARGYTLPGAITQQAEWKMGARLIGFGRKPADYDGAAFQGIHDRYVLVILDEADGIPQALYDAADGLLTSQDCRMLAIGNPHDPTGPFAKACSPGSGWTTVAVSAFDTPNFTGEPVADSLRRLLVSPQWVQERRQRWGESSPRYVSKVLGEFPATSDDTLIPPGWVERAIRTEHAPDRWDATVGVDIARFGSDETIAYLRQGGHVRLAYQGAKQNLMRSAGAVAQIINGHPNRPTANVDDVGVGGGVVDRLNELDYPVAGLNGGTRATDPARFGNARAEWYWQLRGLFEAGEVDLDPADEDLAAQLVAIRYTVDSRGRIWAESKDEMRKRGLPSPDRADALSYAFVSRPAFVVDGGVTTTTAPSLTGDLLDIRW